jgi:hypothetical protein
MSKLTRWQQMYREHLWTLDNEDLFNEMLEANMPVGYNEEFSGIGQWFSKEATRQVIERLELWLGGWFEHLAELLEKLAEDSLNEDAAEDALDLADRIYTSVNKASGST